MQTKVVVIESNGEFVMRTERGMPVGDRLLSIAPDKGKTFPEVPSKPFVTKLEAERSRLAWNLYLAHAWKKRSKSRVRTSE